MPPPRGEPGDSESWLSSRLPEEKVTGCVWICSVRTGEDEEDEDEDGDPWNLAEETPRFSLGGTGGNDPLASDSDKLRPGFLRSA